MPDSEGWTPAPGEAAANIVWYVPIGVWVAALLFAALAIWWAPRPLTRAVVIDQLLRYLFFFPLGVQALWAFFGHVFLAEVSAASIGWAPSPFQFEVGVANLGLALASFYAAFSGFQARAATVVAAACFLVPGNAGPIMITDFLTPIVILVLLLATPRHSSSPPRLNEGLEIARKTMHTALRKPGK